MKKRIIRLLLSVYNRIEFYKFLNEREQIKGKLKHVGDKLNITFPIIASGLDCIEIGNNFYASNNLRIEAIKEYRGQLFNPKITIGDDVSIEQFCHIGAINEIRIDDGVMIASKVFISDHSHGTTNLNEQELKVKPGDRKLISKGKIHIKSNVWIGENVIILSNVTVGFGAIIGANSLVTEDIPDFAVAVGSPAKVIKIMNK